LADDLVEQDDRGPLIRPGRRWPGLLLAGLLAWAIVSCADDSPSVDPTLAGAAPDQGPTAPRFPRGPARLVGSGLSSCSNQAPLSGSGDRWCAFAVGRDAEPPAELWVVRLPGSRPDASPRCDGTSPDCLLLSASLWTGHAPAGPLHPYSHRFDGDTLIFYADAASGPDEVYRGPVYAWRPGFAQARRIASGISVLCSGHPRLPLIHCLEDSPGNSTEGEGVRVTAGELLDDADAMLSSVGRVRSVRAGSGFAWQAGFSPAGDFFAFSSPDRDPALETLQVLATHDLGRSAPRAIIADATFWDFSADGQRVFFLRRDASDQHAVFQADFPAGTRVTELGRGAADVRVFGAEHQEPDATIDP
jgi:hypothetical protein